MEYEVLRPMSEQSQEETFPSTKFLVSTYSAGALCALFWSFVLPLDPYQITTCLFFGWMLSVGALAMSLQIFTAESETSEDDY